jgi:hypothetical protein
MRHRYFNHLYNEICVAVGRRISRYNFWLLMGEDGGDPSQLNHLQARGFVENCLDELLHQEGVSLDPRARRRLERSILCFDPNYPTPEEWMTALFERIEQAA